MIAARQGEAPAREPATVATGEARRDRPRAGRLAGRKILQVCAVDFTALHFLFPVAQRMRSEGAEVHVACGPGRFLEPIRRSGLPVHVVPVRRNLNLASHAISLRRLRRLLAREGYDAVHAHTPIAGLLARVAARMEGVPVVAYTAHGFYFHDATARWLRPLLVALERWGGRLSDLILCVSREDREAARRLGIGRSGQVHYVGNGVDTERFRPDPTGSARRNLRRELGLPSGTPLVGIVGRLIPEKGYGELFRAVPHILHRCPEAHIVCAGEKLASDRVDSQARFLELLRRRGVEGSVHFLGHRFDLPALLPALDVFVLPSHREGLPVSVLEAMACGVPVVASRVRGCRELVDEGTTGILVPPREVGPLAAAVGDLLDDSERAREMGRAGRERVRSGYEESHVLDLQVELLAGTLESAGARGKGVARAPAPS